MTLAAAPTPPRFEHRTDQGPVLGVGTGAPRISWSVPHADASYEQTAYELELTRGEDRSTYRVEGREQVLVPWPALPLTSRERAAVRVRVAHGDDWSDWSQTAIVEAGLLHDDDWTAHFIGPVGVGDLHMPAPVLTGSLDVPGNVAIARLYATAEGVYVASLNGERVGDLILAPGWTAYQHRLRYHVYDVTDLLVEGANVLEVMLGNGWFRGRLGFHYQRAVYGDHLSLLAQLEVTTVDGAVHILGTDTSWTARESEVLLDDLYDGQRTDLRRRGNEWRPAVGAVRVVNADRSRLVAPEGPPVRAVAVLSAREVWTSPGGRTLVDFGQNAVGWVRLRVHGLEPGSEVTVRVAEVLEDGELGTRPLRSARATDSFLVAGHANEVLEPSLTLHGFRYAEVSGVPDLEAEDVEAVVVGTDLTRTGWFASSNEQLNRFHENVVWSMRGNFVDVPTDCPQRDERLGWTGDIQVFGPTATFLFDTVGFLGSWLADLAVEQLPDGSVPHVVPDVIRSIASSSPAAAWGDAATLLPWTIYQRTGDPAILERQFPSMRAWVDKVAALAGPDRLWTGGRQYGDWLDPTAPPQDAHRAKADPDVVATAHFARSAEVVAEAARVLGRDDEATEYARLAAEVRDAFAHAYVTPSGRVVSDAETVYALAIEWDLLPNDEARAEAGRRLADLVRASGFHISTGFVGTPLICDALTSTGHVDVAYRLLLQTGCPSWLYPVTMGATTVWERWDSMLPDGTINDSGMTSFNHYALGAVADWMHRTVAGLAPAAPGYRELNVRPEPNAALTSASARLITPYGEASVDWKRVDGHLEVYLRVPVGTVAHVQLPGAAKQQRVGHGEHSWRLPDVQSNGVGRTRLVTVRDLLDDQATWSAVVAAAVETGITPRGAAQAAERLAAHLEAPAELAAQGLVPDETWPGAQDLQRRVAEILAPVTADVEPVVARSRIH